MNHNKKTAILGVTGSGKTTKLINLYKQYINEGISSNDILVLIRNRGQGIIWREKLDLPYSSKLRITSYFGFIQGEIQKFWPLISKTMKRDFGKLEPTFITIEMAQFLMLQLVEESRKQGKLQALQIDNDRVAIELINNISKAALSGVEFINIGEILLNSREKQDITDRELFFQLQELCNNYIEKCRCLGVLDYAMCVDIYNRSLIKEVVYIDYLIRTTSHIMVDDLEEGVPTEVKLLLELINNVDSFTITYNTDGELGRALGSCPEMVEESILPHCEIHRLEKTYTGSPELKGLNKLTEEIQGNICEDLPQFMIIDKDLRSDMLKGVAEKVLSLVAEGASPSEIAIISPFIDPVIFYYIEDILYKEGYELTNLVRNSNLTDDTYVKALVTVASIAHPQWGLYPSYDNMDLVLSMILNMDRIRSHLISLEIAKQKPYSFPDEEELPSNIVKRIGDTYIKRYSMLKNWIMDYQNGEPLPLYKFFQKFFTEILVSLPETEEHLAACSQLIDNCSQFINILKEHEDVNQVDKKYIEFIFKGMKASESIVELRGKMHTKNIILATPYAYLTMRHNRPIQIWVDTSSDDWFSHDVKEITNPHVFNPHWDKRRIWTDEDSDMYRVKKGNIHIKRLINRCSDNIIFARSQLSRYGYEQNGILGERLDELQTLMHKEQIL